ncbi:MAG: outer membrane lipoprotein carrier protein LolA [Myxococcales bacterium]|nr:outer membrane lipoprotein carrier protein LolA [Myxococcales bacterium]MBK7195238.1 outer membrane lipoprotein carrier protein LolA [Myxococcales bacterium]MBP6847505.1 outer membrane lipoprotein carrier protein LolA [Kofleriaceae bacterium]
MKKILTSLLVSSSLLIPSLALAQAQPARGIFGWFPTPAGKRVAAAPTAAEVMAGVQKFYGGITSVKAKFRQEVTNATFGRTDVSDGTLLIKKPGNMRWQYFSKKKKGKAVVVAKDFISNGSYLYVVDYENKQVIKKDLKKNLLPTAITFLYGKGDLAADFTPELDTSGKYGGKTDFVLKLVPKASSAQYKTLHLVVDPSNYRVKESIIVDGSGNKNHFRFYEPSFGAAIEDASFQFSEKSPKVKAFRIIDGDQEADKQNAPPSAPTTPAP